jgi:periplasmic protein CpxP/Spy
MKRFFSKNALLTLVMMFTLTGSVALAQSSNDQDLSGHKEGRHGHGRRHGAGRHGRIFAQLGLSDTQKEQIKQIHQNHRDTLKPYFQELRARKQELHEIMKGSSFNEAAVTQKLNEMNSSKAKLMGERFKIHQETLAVLTPEQRAKMEQLREQFKAKRGEFRHQRF